MALSILGVESVQNPRRTGKALISLIEILAHPRERSGFFAWNLLAIWSELFTKQLSSEHALTNVDTIAYLRQN